jgi:UTP-glucose-1-phosphate uridylyltransferase
MTIDTAVVPVAGLGTRLLPATRSQPRDGEIQPTVAIRTVIRDGGRLGEGERRYDIGHFDACFRAFVEFALADPRFGARLRRYLEDLLHVSGS